MFCIPTRLPSTDLVGGWLIVHVLLPAGLRAARPGVSLPAAFWPVSSAFGGGCGYLAAARVFCAGFGPAGFRGVFSR